MALDPFDHAELNRQGRLLIRKQDTHAHLTTAENFSIAHHRTAHQRQVAQNTLSDKWSATENNGVEKWEPMVCARIPAGRHHNLRERGLYRGRHCKRYPTYGGVFFTDKM